jgi:hypothetical protein
MTATAYNPFAFGIRYAIMGPVENEPTAIVGPDALAAVVNPPSACSRNVKPPALATFFATPVRMLLVVRVISSVVIEYRPGATWKAMLVHPAVRGSPAALYEAPAATRNAGSTVCAMDGSANIARIRIVFTAPRTSEVP